MSDETTNREETPTQTGNAAKLQDALENLARFDEADLRQLEHLANRAIDEDIYGGGILLAIVGAIREGKKALAAPPRNCDLYATADEAMDAFDKFGCPNDCGDCPYADDGEGEMAKYCQVNWLFAPAAQEGGDHADV